MPGKIVAVGAALGAAALVAGWALVGPARETPPLLAWQDAQTVARGEAIYAGECAACHGPLGEAAADPAPGAAPAHDATGHTWRHPDYALVQLTRSGEAADFCRTLDASGMPRFSDSLGDREILDVLAYIKSTWPEDIRAAQEELNLLHRAQNEAYRALLAEQ